jgi:hypothetical protein
MGGGDAGSALCPLFKTLLLIQLGQLIVIRGMAIDIHAPIISNEITSSIGEKYEYEKVFVHFNRGSPFYFVLQPTRLGPETRLPVQIERRV